jgi:hypothetical protein
LQSLIGNQAMGRLLRAAMQPTQGKITESGQAAPESVHDALKSPGSPLAPDTRAFIVSRFASDFSRVPVHADVRSTQSATLPRTSNLRVSSPTDPAELEAERVTAEVMRMPAPSAAPEVQRKCACDDEEIRRDATTDASVQVPPLVNQVLGSSGQPLPDSARGFFEPRMGFDFSHVRIHTDAQAARSADAVQARAYTVGSHIVFAAGHSPLGAADHHLLAHELVHVIQQGGSDPAAGIWRHQGSVRVDSHAEHSGEVIYRNQSVHPEEQHCEDVSKEPDPGCAAIIDCIEVLIEELAGRFHDVETLGGDPGHFKRIEIVQGILKTLMAMALLACKAGEYDPELQEEAEKWAGRQFRQVAPEPGPSTRERIAKALQDAGVPAWAVAALVVLIIAALADPEPFSKIVALIGATAAVLFFIAIGRSGDIPPGQAATASNDQPVHDRAEETANA